MNILRETLTGIRRGGIGLITTLLLVMPMAKADVTQNITFTVKSDGRVEAWSDIGTFDASGRILTVNASQMPAELRDSTLKKATSYYHISVNPVGFDISGTAGALASGTKIPSTIRLLYMRAVPGGSVGAYTTSGSCLTGNYGFSSNVALSSQGKPFPTLCESRRIYDNAHSDRYRFMTEELHFEYFENNGGAIWLKTQKFPAGTYTFPSRTFQLNSQFEGPGQSPIIVPWHVNLRVIVEPSMAEVNMPSTMEMVVRDTGNNRLVGEGAVQVSAQGTLGRNLRIEPRSANGGKLMKGAEEIPYTLSVSTLAGDYKPHLLIDNGRVQTPAVIPLYGREFDYPLRLSAHFDTQKSGLTSGNFRDRVTLVFSTTDIP